MCLACFWGGVFEVISVLFFIVGRLQPDGNSILNAIQGGVFVRMVLLLNLSLHVEEKAPLFGRA